MNWKKILLATLGGGVAGNVASWAAAVSGGQHVPFTVGTILAPAVPGILTTLLALFTHRPQDH